MNDGSPDPENEEPNEIEEGNEPLVDHWGDLEAVEPAIDFVVIFPWSWEDEEDANWSESSDIDTSPYPREEWQDRSVKVKLLAPDG